VGLKVCERGLGEWMGGRAGRWSIAGRWSGLESCTVCVLWRALAARWGGWGAAVAGLGGRSRSGVGRRWARRRRRAE